MTVCSSVTNKTTTSCVDSSDNENLDSLRSTSASPQDNYDASTGVFSAGLGSAWMVPLLWSEPAQAAEATNLKVLTQSYDGSTFTGKISARMTIPNLDKALKICTGEDIAAYRKFPGIREATYSAGTLRYVLYTSNLGPVSVRDLGYSLSMSIDRSQEAAGVTKVLWKNSGTQPSKDAAGEPLTNFLQNNGGWEFRKVPGTADQYDVIWSANTTVNPDSLQWGSSMISNSSILSQSITDATKVVQTMAKLAE